MSAAPPALPKSDARPSPWCTLTSGAPEKILSVVQTDMKRRESLKGLGFLAGGSLLSPSVLAEFFRVSAAVVETGGWTPGFVPARHAALLPELVEVIIPATDTPGAKEALVHIFVDLFVRDCYPKPQQDVFDSVTREVGELLDADGSSLVRWDGERAHIVATWSREGFQPAWPARPMCLRCDWPRAKRSRDVSGALMACFPLCYPVPHKGGYTS